VELQSTLDQMLQNQYAIVIFIYGKNIHHLHAAADFSLHTVIVSAERVDGPTPGARVTWSTTVPPECVASVTVEFRTSRSGSVVRSYTTTSTSETEVIQTGLQCETIYYIKVVVTGVPSLGTVNSNRVNVSFEGKIARSCTPYDELCSKYCTIHNWNLFVLLYRHPFNLTSGHTKLAIVQLYWELQLIQNLS